MLQPNAELTDDDQLAVGPSGRGAGIWLLPDDADERARLGAEVSAHLEHEVEGIDLLAWLTPEGERRTAGRRSAAAASNCASGPASRSATRVAAAGSSTAIRRR